MAFIIYSGTDAIVGPEDGLLFHLPVPDRLATIVARCEASEVPVDVGVDDGWLPRWDDVSFAGSIGLLAQIRAGHWHGHTLAADGTAGPAWADTLAGSLPMMTSPGTSDAESIQYTRCIDRAIRINAVTAASVSKVTLASIWRCPASPRAPKCGIPRHFWCCSALRLYGCVCAGTKNGLDYGASG